MVQARPRMHIERSMNMNAPLIALASILFAASVSAEQDPFTTPTRGEVKKTSIEPPRPERNIARIPRAITYSKNKNGQNVYKLTGLYSHSDEKNDASHAAYYKMLIPKCTGISMDRALGTCIITTSRKLSNSELAYAIDDMAESGDEIPYWRELEARDIPKSKAFSKTTYTIAPYQRGLPPDLAWFGVDDTMTPVPLGLRSEVGSLLIVPTTAYCMDYSRFALRVLDKEGHLIWQDEETAYGDVTFALAGTDSPYSHKVFIKREDHGKVAQFLMQINIEQAGAGQPATKPADKSPVKDQPSTPTPKDVTR